MITSLNISSSYNTNRLEQSLGTFWLLSQQQESSPIVALNSPESSNGSPQVLFPQYQMHKKLMPEFNKTSKVNETSQRTEQHLQSKLQTFLQGQIHQSFQIDENQGPFRYITSSNLHERVSDSQNKQNIEVSHQNSPGSIIKINHTVSRHLQVNPFAYSARRSPFKEFELNLSELKDNVTRLKSIVQRFQNHKRYKTLDRREIPEIESEYVRNVPINVKKNSQSTESGNKISKINAKSAKSEDIVNGTPIKQAPIVSDFNLLKSLSKSQIDQMSPIVSIPQYSQLSQKKLNTSQISSRMLMKKKFNWKSNRLMNSQ